MMVATVTARLGAGGKRSNGRLGVRETLSAHASGHALVQFAFKSIKSIRLIDPSVGASLATSMPGKTSFEPANPDVASDAPTSIFFYTTEGTDNAGIRR
jgi:hypothetical protein